MLRQRLKTRTPWFILGIIAACIIPLFIRDPYILDVIIVVFIFTIFTTCIYQIFVTNRLLFGSAAFVGIGAYVSVLLVVDWGQSFWLATVAAGLASAVVGFLIGRPILRVAGIYFAIITWCIGEVFVTIYKNVPLFRGTSGIVSIPPPSIFGVELASKFSFYYIALALVLLTLVFFYRLGQSRYGRDLKAVGFSDMLAASLGINLPRYRLVNFTIACFFLGMGGSLYAHYTTCLFPPFFDIGLSEEAFVFMCIGGAYSIWGGLIGSIICVVLPELFHAIEYWRPLLYGALFILVIMFMPRGFISLPHQWRLWMKGRIRE